MSAGEGVETRGLSYLHVGVRARPEYNSIRGVYKNQISFANFCIFNVF